MTRLATALSTSLLTGITAALLLYATSYLIYRPVGNGFDNVATLSLALLAFAVPFFFAILVGLVGRRDGDASVRTVSTLAALLTVAAVGVLEFVTWRAVLGAGTDNASTASIAFVTVPIIGVVVIVCILAVGLVVAAIWQRMRIAR